MGTHWIVNIISARSEARDASKISSVGRPKVPAKVRRHISWLGAVLLSCLILTGCNNVELYSNLNERQANEIVATLQRSGILAKRSIGKGNLFAVTVNGAHFANAVRILNDNGLPKEGFSSLGEVFKKDGLISTPVQERAQMIFALSQELSRTVSDIDGVVSARVHLVLPENDPLRQQLTPSSASVFIRHQANAPVTNLVPQVKMLVANGVAGLAYDKVSVVLVPVERRDPPEGADPGYASFLGLWLHRDSLDPAIWLFSSLIALVLGLGAALGALLWRGRRRIYVLEPAAPVKRS